MFYRNFAPDIVIHQSWITMEKYVKIFDEFLKLGTLSGCCEKNYIDINSHKVAIFLFTNKKKLEGLRQRNFKKIRNTFINETTILEITQDYKLSLEPIKIISKKAI